MDRPGTTATARRQQPQPRAQQGACHLVVSASNSLPHEAGGELFCFFAGLLWAQSIWQLDETGSYPNVRGEQQPPVSVMPVDRQRHRFRPTSPRHRSSPAPVPADVNTRRPGSTTPTRRPLHLDIDGSSRPHASNAPSPAGRCAARLRQGQLPPSRRPRSAHPGRKRFIAHPAVQRAVRPAGPRRRER